MKEIVIIIGYNAAGKTTLTKSYLDKGYVRVNRDTMGGSLADVIEEADKQLRGGAERLVMDNTYPTVEQRAGVVKLGKKHNIPVRCVWLNTSFEDAQLNACMRMMQRIGKIADSTELKKLNDPNLFPPVAIFNYKKVFEKPTNAEGFSIIDKIEFKREFPKDWKNAKALIVDFDDTLRRSTGPEPYPTKPEHVELLPGRAEILQKYKDDGYLLFGASNQSGVAKKKLTHDDAVACFEATIEKLGVKFDEYMFCPHNIPPVSCFCRKPHPGIGAYFISKYQLDPSQCIMVGDQTSDKTFASRCGFRYFDQDEFFCD